MKRSTKLLLSFHRQKYIYPRLYKLCSHFVKFVWKYIGSPVVVSVVVKMGFYFLLFSILCLFLRFSSSPRTWKIGGTVQYWKYRKETDTIFFPYVREMAITLQFLWNCSNGTITISRQFSMYTSRKSILCSFHYIFYINICKSSAPDSFV